MSRMHPWTQCVRLWICMCGATVQVNEPAAPPRWQHACKSSSLGVFTSNAICRLDIPPVRGYSVQSLIVDA